MVAEPREGHAREGIAAQMTLNQSLQRQAAGCASLASCLPLSFDVRRHQPPSRYRRKLKLLAPGALYV